MNILCIACNPPTNWASEKEYKDHLVTAHGTDSPDEALKLERLKKANSPTKLPLGVPPEAAPTPEFIKTMAEIDRSKTASQATPPPPVSASKPPELKPLILKYRFDGNCPKCNNPVRTIVNEFEGKLIANAYCMFCDETVLQVPVEKIPRTNGKIPTWEEVEKDIKTKKKGKNGGSDTK